VSSLDPRLCERKLSLISNSHASRLSSKDPLSILKRGKPPDWNMPRCGCDVSPHVSFVLSQGFDFLNCPFRLVSGNECFRRIGGKGHSEMRASPRVPAASTATGKQASFHSASEQRHVRLPTGRAFQLARSSRRPHHGRQSSKGVSAPIQCRRSTSPAPAAERSPGAHRCASSLTGTLLNSYSELGTSLARPDAHPPDEALHPADKID
jgi:hypothetical protein